MWLRQIKVYLYLSYTTHVCSGFYSAPFSEESWVHHHCKTSSIFFTRLHSSLSCVCFFFHQFCSCVCQRFSSACALERKSINFEESSGVFLCWRLVANLITCDWSASMIYWAGFLKRAPWSPEAQWPATMPPKYLTGLFSSGMNSL